MTATTTVSASPLLSLRGAVAGDGIDAPVAAHYGELFREQRELAAGRGFVDLSHRGVITVSGPERLTWLHLLLTQHVSQLPPQQAADALVLSPNGHVEHALYLVDDGATTWIHVEPGTTGELVAYLEKMKFFSQVEIADATADYAVVHLPAGHTATAAEAAAVRELAHGRDLFLPRAELAAATAGYGAPAGLWAYEALRIEGHRPRLGFETDHRTIPHELGWLGTAVHLDKGCYRGQETVARVNNLGRPPRRLVFLHLDGSMEVLPPHGAEVRVAADGPGGRPVGFVTSSVRHYELGPVALALVKRNVPVDAELVAGTVPATQDVIVPQ
ncbi:CAF17-like 4Fe-4S cluster assembly/insertion protein YgfZ [Streptacidiphilus sp. PAMC 29251]